MSSCLLSCLFLPYTASPASGENICHPPTYLGPSSKDCLACWGIIISTIFSLFVEFQEGREGSKLISLCHRLFPSLCTLYPLLRLSTQTMFRRLLFHCGTCVVWLLCAQPQIPFTFQDLTAAYPTNPFCPLQTVHSLTNSRFIQIILISTMLNMLI